MTQREPLRIGIGGPVGSGKTALMDWLCKSMRGRFELVAITNDIYTREDAEFLTRSGALPADSDPRGRLDQSGRDRRYGSAVPRGRHRSDRVGRRQSGGDLLARTGR